jgi:selT/selW/selH-like putative selenoprotein|tara:strand:- start:18 stop:179 length:162 start_codon:yes stop_codon:yes gene_type:complete
LAAAIEARFKGVEIELIESSGGVFEVVSEGKLIYSKKATGRHATHEEVLDALN